MFLLFYHVVIRGQGSSLVVQWLLLTRDCGSDLGRGENLSSFIFECFSGDLYKMKVFYLKCYKVYLYERLVDEVNRGQSH